MIAGVETNASALQGLPSLFDMWIDFVEQFGGLHIASQIVLNSRMRRIDLLCKLTGPLVISLIDGFATDIAILVTLGMSVLSVGIEYFPIAQVFQNIRVENLD